MHRTGMYLVVDCDDFNCDVRLLETAYGLPTGSVRCCPAPSTRLLPRRWPGCPSEGSMLHLGCRSNA